MTYFIDTRTSEVGGDVAKDAKLTDLGGGQIVDLSQFKLDIADRDLLIATHGFNVPASASIFSVGARTSLDSWRQAMTLPQTTLFVGALWPGDSITAPLINYPDALSVATAAAKTHANFLIENCARARSVSFVSHSLGALFMLETISALPDDWPPEIRSLILMAAAVDRDCLATTYKDVVPRIGRIHNIASRRDAVLHFAFPLGNPIGQWLMGDAPEFIEALGREGPLTPLPAKQRGNMTQIPGGETGATNWAYGHLSYLPSDALIRFAPAVTADLTPTAAEPNPLDDPDWRPAWSASMVSFDLSS